MPRTPTLLLLAALCCAHAATARAQEGQAETKPRPAADALRAEQLCEQGRAHAARGAEGASEALDSFARAFRLYVRIFSKERPDGSGAATQSAFRARMRELLRAAPRCVEDYLALGRGSPFERGQLEAFGGQVSMLVEADEARAAFLSSELDKRALITRRPHPGFTEEARRNNVHGRVRLRAVLAADGSVRHVLVLEGLTHGLTEECVNAARGIRFTPAVKNGRPVSQFIVLEYNFNTH